MRGINQAAIAPNTSGFQEVIESAAAGPSAKPTTIARSTNVSPILGSTKNLITAPNTAAAKTPIKRCITFGCGFCTLGANTIIKIADHVMANAPLGQAVTIQKNSAAPTRRNTLPALMTAVSRSGTPRHRPPARQATGVGSTKMVGTSNACDKPANALAASSASNRSDGDSAGIVTSILAAATLTRRR